MKLNVANLLQIEHNCRNTQSYEELRYTIVNETRKLVPYKAALFFCIDSKQNLKVEAISDVATINTNSIFVQTLESIGTKALKDSDTLHEIDTQKQLDTYEKKVLDEYSYKHLLFIPIKVEKNDASIQYYMILLNDETYEKKHLEVISHLSSSYAYFLYAMTKNSFRSRIKKSRFFSGYFKYIFILIVLVMFIPVKLSVLAPLEVIPKNPFIVNSPLEAAVKKIEVNPNDEVKEGELLVVLDDTFYKNKYEVAKKTLDIAKAQLHTSSQASFYDINQKRKIAELKTQVELKKTALEYAKQQLEKTKIYAKKDAIAIVHNPNEWKGKPVIIGEKILYLADKKSVELKIMLPVSDAIFIEKNSKVKAFFDNDPLNSWDARVKYISYKPQLSNQNVLSYEIIASFENEKNQEIPTIGLRGTAKIYSQEVTLFFYLFKKPITSLRQYIGW